MKRGSRILLFVGSLVTLMFLDAPAWLPVPDGFVGEANAIIGRPITPVSYAGVARRTSRRVVRRNVAYSSAAAATYTTAPVLPASPPAYQPAGAPPIGTVVNQLPSGCVSRPRGGIEYFNCNGVFYRPVVQGNSLVYMVENP